ncbi:triphosphoribosyl-dephospho-CoA synthase [bacterium]|nr:triphosphoribosyl-dephospho-CoA synthase [bacterium]
MNSWTLAQIVEQACREEVLACKPGNVHPGAPFDDLVAEDFLRSAQAIAPEMARAGSRSVGETILQSVRATREVAPSNTNLGIIILFAPVCRAIALGGLGREAVVSVLRELTVEDAELAFQAIREAMPGGLGKVDQQDVTERPTVTLREAMSLAAERDSIARAYANDFFDIWAIQAQVYRPTREQGLTREEAVVWSQIVWMARFPDTLIARKLGRELAEESAHRAHRIVEAWRMPVTTSVVPRPGFLQSRELVDFDRWLREDGHMRNPGTSADLVAATLLIDLWQTSI